PGWTPGVRDALEAMVRAGPGLAALDFDKTCLTGDVSETLLARLAAASGRDLVGEYEAACAVDLRAAYVDLVPTLIAGRTEAEIRALALATFRSGMAVREPIRELVWAMHRGGWEVWVVTASAEVVVQPVAEQLGIHPHRVLGMRSPVGPDGRFVPVVTEPITYREGKLAAIRAATGADPTFAAGDSRSDAPMMAAARYALLLDHGDPALRDEAAARGWWVEPEERIR
ncbi:MAG: HAD-IB family phosphatase, partial [Myxococcota bacterium]